MKNSLSNRTIILAWQKGYRTTLEGEIISPSGKKRKLDNRRSYKSFSVRTPLGGTLDIFVHRFVAYAKFKDALFQKGVVVRHLDGDCKNNAYDNIEIGTQRQNSLDRAPKDRLVHAKSAAKTRRKLNEKDVVELRKLRENGWLLQALGNKYNISKSTVFGIVTKKTYKDI